MVNLNVIQTEAYNNLNVNLIKCTRSNLNLNYNLPFTT